MCPPGPLLCGRGVGARWGAASTRRALGNRHGALLRDGLRGAPRHDHTNAKKKKKKIKTKEKKTKQKKKKKTKKMKQKQKQHTKKKKKKKKKKAKKTTRKKKEAYTATASGKTNADKSLHVKGAWCVPNLHAAWASSTNHSPRSPG